MVAFAALFTALTAMGFGLFPASGRPPHRIRRASRGRPCRRRSEAAPPRRARHRRSDDVGDPADFLGLLIRAVWRVQAIDPGFVAENVLTLQTALPRPKYDSPVRRGEFYERVLARGARAAGRPERGVHERPADGDDRHHHRCGDPRPGDAATHRRRQPPLGDIAILQNHGHSVSSRRDLEAATPATARGSPWSARRSRSITGPVRIPSAGRSDIKM